MCDCKAGTCSLVDMRLEWLQSSARGCEGGLSLGDSLVEVTAAQRQVQDNLSKEGLCMKQFALACMKASLGPLNLYQLTHKKAAKGILIVFASLLPVLCSSKASKRDSDYTKHVPSELTGFQSTLTAHAQR